MKTNFDYDGFKWNFKNPRRLLETATHRRWIDADVRSTASVISIAAKHMRSKRWAFSRQTASLHSSKLGAKMVMPAGGCSGGIGCGGAAAATFRRTGSGAEYVSTSSSIWADIAFQQQPRHDGRSEFLCRG